LKRSDVVDNSNIAAGDVIVGLSSYGQATYEDQYNSGIGSNGLTSARHDIFNKQVAEMYPETYDEAISKYAYTGKFGLLDTHPSLPVNMGMAVLSPTRTYAPILIPVLNEYRHKIHGLVHCSGGGQKKVLHFLPTGLKVVKDKMMPIAPLFKIIQESSNTDWSEMYQVFNMGHRMEVYTDESTAEAIIKLANSFHVDAQVIGHVECMNADGVRWELKTDFVHLTS
jgi:phosphoribosylformylglycinamidine cyclo-ligase